MNYLIFIFLLLIPTQLGKHFWPDFALVNGIRVDYLSPTLYLLDILAIALVVLGIRKIKIKWWWFLFAGMNIIVAQNKSVAIIAWIRIFEIYGVYKILKENKELVKIYLKYIIPFWIILESGLGFLQVIKGESVQWLFYYLGERRFNLNTIGIAKIDILGREYLRAYGTFSHPNSLAGFLLVVLELWKNNRRSLWYWIIRWLGIFGILICASRIAILLLQFYFWPVFMILSGWDSLSFKKRMLLNVEAIKMILSYPLFGVGLNNYLVNSKYYQPVHNVYLLIWSQLGIVSFGIFYNFFSLKKSKIFWIVLLTSLVDHYWVTLPQNWWLLAVVLAL